MLEDVVGQRRCLFGSLDTWKVSVFQITELLSYPGREH